VPTLREVTAALDSLYDPRRAEPWDAIGLVCGDPGTQVERVLLAVDPVAAVVREALDWGADLLVTHHPLFLRPVHEVAATSPKGRVVHDLIRGGCALQVAHTNADSADPGVSDALAAALGLTDLRPLAAQPDEPSDKLVTFVPHADVGRVLDALAAAGAGRIGAYERCAWTAPGTGTFRPTEGASPTIGSVGAVEEVPESRLELVVPRRLRRRVVEALRVSHPYEEPAFDVYELAVGDSAYGIGRVGRLAAVEPLTDFVRRVAAALPVTAAGVRAAGDPATRVRRVAVCGGAGDSLLDAVRVEGVDAYVTADLRHHPTSEARAHPGGPALVDVAHWASEWPWLADAARRLTDRLARQGATVVTRVSETPTDPWTLHEGSAR
jgi:dinuclear metal center YbgI/SA1388 family protein